MIRRAFINPIANWPNCILRRKNIERRLNITKKVLAGLDAGNDSIRGRIFPKLGGEYLKFNDYQKATDYLIQGLNISRRSNDKPGLLTSLNNLGELNLKQNRLILAERQLLEAGSIAKSLDNKQELLKYYNSMKALDSTKRRFDRAFVWQREYYNLKSSLDKNAISLSTEAALEFDPDFDKASITKTVDPSTDDKLVSGAKTGCQI